MVAAGAEGAALVAGMLDLGAAGADGGGGACVAGIGAAGAEGGGGGVAGIGAAGAGGGGGGAVCMPWSWASSEPATVIELAARSARRVLRDFIVVTPCQNAWPVDGCARSSERGDITLRTAPRWSPSYQRPDKCRLNTGIESA